MHYLRLKIGIILACAGLALGIANATESKPLPEKDLPVVTVRTIKNEEISDTYTYPARVHPRINAILLADSDGVVTKVFSPIGAKVKKGDRLIQIKNTDPVYQYAASYVVAPVAGVVSSLNVREGTQVQKNQEVVAVTDPSQVRINLEIAAIDLNAFHAGSVGKFKISGRDEWMPVKIIGISPFVKPSTGTATCELSISGGKTIIHPGLVGQVTFQANSRRGIIVPTHALNYRRGGVYLRVIDSELVSRSVAVQLGRKQRGLVEILSGVESGETIIEHSSKFVGEGQKVQIEAEKEQG